MSVQLHRRDDASTSTASTAATGPGARTGTAVPRVLAIAGSDPSGGAGIQADLKSVAAADGYGMTAVTALTAQNTRGVRGVHTPPAAFLADQLAAVTDDVAIDAVKIGMLGAADVVAVVADWLGTLPSGATRRRPPVVLDPVMIATSGDRLLDDDAERALTGLLGLVDVVTPNLPELAVLAGEPVAVDWPAALDQARRLAARHDVLVVAKGGHLDGPAGADVPDALVGPGGLVAQVGAARVGTTATHGTGCSLSAGLATRYARHHDWARALRETKDWLTRAIAAGEALAVGEGNGPVDHLVAVRAGGPVLPAAGGAPGDVARWLADGAAPAGVVDGRAEGTAERTVADGAARAEREGAALVADWWAAAAPLRARIDDLPFVRALGDGTLGAAHFRYYLEQDALYLRDYARALARAAELAPTRAEQAFWAGGAHGALVTELDLHGSWLGGEPHDVARSPTTRAYLDHLRTAGSDYPTLVAAVLPCYWIYADVGERLAARNHDAHPYAAWLSTYADDAFAAATREAVAILRRTAGAATAEQRDRMRSAFARACLHEVAFFDQAHAWASEGPARP